MSSKLLIAILVALLPVLVGTLLRRYLQRTQPLTLTETSGSIRPVRWLVWFAVVILISIGLLMLVIAFDVGWEFSVILVLVAVFLIACAAGGILKLMDPHIVYWHAEGMEGPSKNFGFPPGKDRAAIAWSDIVKAGRVWSSNYVQAADDRRIYWSEGYGGYTHLHDAITRHCPSVKLPKPLQI